MSMITALLHRLREINERAAPGLRLLEPPVHVRQLATLADHRYIPISPMLSQRFDFAGAWKNAALAQDWLSPDEMKAAWTDAAIRQQLSVRREHWEASVFATHPTNRLTLFAIDRIDGNETYLLWPEEPAQEPGVVVYASHQTHEFDDLRAFAKWLVGDA